MNCFNCKNYEPLQLQPEQPEPTELPPLMTQRFKVIDCLLELSSVAGDLYIIQSQKFEMSLDLRQQMEDLTELLKTFNNSFCNEY